jgi:hypothetical protein
MNQTLCKDSAGLWEQLRENYWAYRLAFRTFFSEGVDRVEALRPALRGRDRDVALHVANSLTEPEREALFPEWVYLASFSHGAIHIPREIIQSMPREWVLLHIEREAEPLLRGGTDDEYRRFLELYELLDLDLTRRLARRAAAHADPDIREAGEDFLMKFGDLPQRQETA